MSFFGSTQTFSRQQASCFSTASTSGRPWSASVPLASFVKATLRRRQNQGFLSGPALQQSFPMTNNRAGTLLTGLPSFIVKLSLIRVSCIWHKRKSVLGTQRSFQLQNNLAHSKVVTLQDCSHITFCPCYLL